MPRKVRVQRAPSPPLADAGLEFVSDGAKRTKAEIMRMAWESGLISPLILRKHQVPLYQAIMDTPRLKVRPILCSRRFGKTMTVLTCIEEVARQHPGSIIRLSFPTIKQAQTVIMPNWRKVLASCPEDLRPVDRTSMDEGAWTWPKHVGPCKCGDPLCVTGPGPSMLYLAGTDDTDQRERQRGADANWAFLDEAGSQKELKYMVSDILSPQLDEVNGRLVMITTPPRSLSHDFVEFWDQGIQNGLLFLRTIFDNSYNSDAKTRDICEERNPRRTGEHPEDYKERVDNILKAGSNIEKAKKAGASGTWIREYLAGRVGDSEISVCEEFSEEEFVHEAVRPAHVTRYVFLDQGHVTDFFAVTFAEHDFASGKLRVLAEYQARRRGTAEIVAALKAIEVKLWCPAGGKTWEEVPREVMRWSDDPRGEQQLYDMRGAPHNYSVSMAGVSPGDEENSRAVRYHMGAGHIEIDPRCTNLIAQCRDGTFKEKAGGKQEFERTKSFGHLDLFASLALGVRVVNWRKSAIPAGVEQSTRQNVMQVPVRKQESATVKRLKSLFRGAYA